MTGSIGLLCSALAAALLIAAAPAGSDADVNAYRVHVRVTSTRGSTVQRLRLPATVLAAAQTRDGSDLRVFDARGRPMPIARIAAAAPELRRDVLEALPILGAADGLKVRGVSLRLDPDGRARVARVNGTVEDAGGSVVLGTLFDARAVAGAARALVLDVDVPPAQPVTFRVEASRDLAAWRKLGERVIYRAPAARGAGSRATMGLGGASVARDYLKVTWSLASRALSPVLLRGGVLLSRPGGGAGQTILDADLPPLKDAHAVTFVVPFRTPVATVRIIPRDADVLVPVRILGRDDPEQPWTVLGDGVATRATDRPEPAGAIALNGATFRTLRIEADARSPGFTATPGVRFGFAPREILFLAAGSPPYTLAAGRSGAGGVYLPAASLMAAATGQRAGAAVVTERPGQLALAAVDDAAVNGRRAVLWAVLLAATGLLAVLAWLLWTRQRGTTDNPG